MHPYSSEDHSLDLVDVFTHQNFSHSNKANKNESSRLSGQNKTILDKKERNKQSAKLSRDRKKMYISILQQKHKSLSKAVSVRRKQLEQTKRYLQKVMNQNKTINLFASSRQKMIRSLEQCLEKAKVNGNDPSSQINTIIDELRSKVGATGQQRRKTINQYFAQILHMFLPALHRYMMWSAMQGRHLFAEDEKQQEQDEWFKQLKDALNLSEEQKKQIYNKGEFLREQKKQLNQLIGGLEVVKEQIEKKSIELEDMIDRVREILNPIQCAYFILFIEKNKYRKQINLCEATSQFQASRKLVKEQ